jgi:galactokinase
MLDQHLHDLPATIGKRCSHVIRENCRTGCSASTWEGDLSTVGKLMRESHQPADSMRSSKGARDIMVEAAEGLPASSADA